MVAEPAATLEKKNEWTPYSTIFKPGSMTTGGILFLYADAGEKNTPTEVLYDNVRAIKLPSSIDSLALVAEPPTTSLATTSSVPTVSYRRVNTGHYDVSITGAREPYFLNFLEQFDVGWQATIDGQPIETTNHLRAYGYANTWYLDKTGDYTVTLRFTPQRIFFLSSIGSLIGLTMCLLLIALGRKRGKRA